MNSQYLINKNNEDINELIQHKKNVPVLSVFTGALGGSMKKSSTDM